MESHGKVIEIFFWGGKSVETVDTEVSVCVTQDIVLVPQPSDALPHCHYYLTLTTPESAPRPLQVKVGDCVYVTRDGAEPLSDELISHPASAGDRLDIFRVERLWIKYKYVVVY